MPRLAVVCLLTFACGSDANRPIDPDGPDAGAGRDASQHTGDANVTSDATPADADCAEAVLHSDFTWIQDKILTPSCATPLCHTGPDAEVGLRLDAGEAYNNLVNKGASTVTGWVRVVPGSTTSSYLVVALGRADGPPPRDGFMPIGADPLCVEKLEAIERWISGGALP